MADRTSAELFGRIFGLLAKNPTEEHKEIAREIFGFSNEYDFSHYQMYAEEACQKLGLCQRGIDPDYPEEGECWLWYGDKGFNPRQGGEMTPEPGVW